MLCFSFVPAACRCLWVVVLCFCTLGCDKIKKEMAQQAARQEDIPTVATTGQSVVKQKRIMDDADRLGFIARLPADTQIYLGTLRVRNHLATLSETVFFNEIKAYLDDKTPAPTGSPTKVDKPILPPLWTDDAFLAIGEGGVEALAILKDLAKQNNAEVFRNLALSLMPAASKATPKSEPKPEPAQSLLSQLQIPAITLGLRAENAETGIAALLPESFRTALSKLGPQSEVTLPDKAKFFLHEGTVGKLLSGLDTTKWPAWAAFVGTLADKPLSVAYGYVSGHAVLTFGSARPDFQFAKTPEESLLSGQEWDALVPQVSKPLVGISWVNGKVLEATHQGEWLAPILEDLVTTIKEERSHPLKKLASTLEAPLKQLLESEQRYFEKSYTHMAAVGWWSQGLQVQAIGGLTAASYGHHDELRFSPLLEEADTLFGYAGHLADTELQRYDDLMKAWGAVLGQAARGYVGGFSGEQAATLTKWLDEDVFPPFTQAHQASMKLSREGLGSERAWVLTARAPTDKTTPLQAALAHVATVRDRRALSRAWLDFEPALTNLQKAFPMLAGVSFSEIQPEVKSKLNAYALPLPIPLPGIEPCVLAGDENYLLSTSAALAGNLAVRLSEKKAQMERDCSQWRLNVPLLRQIILGASESAEATASLRSMTHWLAPLGPLRFDASITEGQVQRQWHWQMKDTERFD
jgi:hypothetical protein